MKHQMETKKFCKKGNLTQKAASITVLELLRRSAKAIKQIYGPKLSARSGRLRVVSRAGSKSKATHRAVLRHRRRYLVLARRLRLLLQFWTLLHMRPLRRRRRQLQLLQRLDRRMRWLQRQRSHLARRVRRFFQRHHLLKHLRLEYLRPMLLFLLLAVMMSPPLLSLLDQHLPVVRESFGPREEVFPALSDLLNRTTQPTYGAKSRLSTQKMAKLQKYSGDYQHDHLP